MKPILTHYQPTKSSGKLECWWIPLRLECFDASNKVVKAYKSDEPVREFKQWRDDIRAKKYRQMKFCAVTGPGVTWDSLRTEYRGFTTYPERKLIDPIVIRGKELPEIECQVDTDGFVYFSSTGYQNSLTDGQRSTLKEWFGSQLAAQMTPDLIRANVEECIERDLARCRARALEKHKLFSEIYASFAKV